MKLLQTSSLLTISLVLSACAATPGAASDDVVSATAKEITPDFECALFYSQIDESDKINESIDKAISRAENNGLNIPQSTAIYGQVKQSARAEVLERAIELAADSPNVIPRLDGSPPPPNAAIELQAWKELFQDQCT